MNHPTKFAPIRRVTVADTIAEEIRTAILSGQYAPGDPLPPEREMAQQFEVNRSSVREALHRLEGWSLIETRHGGGTRVRDFMTDAGLNLLPFLLAPGGKLDDGFLNDLLELRVALLGFTAEAASRASDPEGPLKQMEALVDQIDESEDAGRTQELDWSFFEALVDLAGNRVLRLMANVIRDVYFENREAFLPLYAAGLPTDQHRRVLAALARGDGEEARAGMEEFGRLAILIFAMQEES